MRVTGTGASYGFGCELQVRVRVTGKGESYGYGCELRLELQKYRYKCTYRCKHELLGS